MNLQQMSLIFQYMYLTTWTLVPITLINKSGSGLRLSNLDVENARTKADRCSALTDSSLSFVATRISGLRLVAWAFHAYKSRITNCNDRRTNMTELR